MQFTIDPSVSAIFPYVGVAWVRIQLRSDAKARADVLESLKAAALERLLQRVSNVAELEQLDSVQEWFEGYRKMGLRPKKVKPTHYAFNSRLVKDRRWPRAIGPLVDAYLINQVKHVMPHGGFDVDRLPCGDCCISLLRSEAETTFQPLGVAETETDRLERTKKGEVIYQCRTYDDTIPITLTRHLNHRDCERTKIFDDHENEGNSTRDFALLIESLDPSPEARKRLLDTAEDLLQTYVDVYGQQGVVQSFIRVVAAGQRVSDEENSEGGATLNLDW